MTLHDRLSPYIALAKRYEAEEVQTKARQIIPLSRLMITAQQKAGSINQELKKNHASSNEKFPDKAALLKQCLLLELLHWFKSEFFAWFDRENCLRCENLNCVPVHHSTLCIPTADERRFGGDRIEVYQCPQCRQHYRFPRYNDPLKLLETRRGRCGEWANAFTLCCRACGFDARFVLDFTDHVWTEVWSELEGRWLHCDPCENVCDKPLLYESGWGKELSYVFAFSRDELVDVTWRYTSKPLVLKRRRTLMDELQLLRQIDLLNRNYYSAILSPQRANITLQRRLIEVVEFFNCTRRTASSDERLGRSSGSLAWRVARGETSNLGGGSNAADKKFVFALVDVIDQRVGTIRIEYDVIKDKHAVYHDGRPANTYDRWLNCVYLAQNVERKEEHDWKMVYLCRADGSDAKIDGSVEWRFNLSLSSSDRSGAENRNIKIGKVFVQANNTACYDSGSVKWSIAVHSNDGSADLGGGNDADDAVKVSGKELQRVSVDAGALENGYDCKDLLKNFVESSEATILSVSATMSGGEGDIGWQQAQIFRSSMKKHENDSSTAQFVVTIQLERP